nr:GntR family transcriptional regulator [uncultured Cohaesibacter sp.]
MEEIERPPSLSDIATEKLRAAISEGEFALGEALSEQKLADRLNISKTPIRHALAQMKVEGLVEVFPQKGTFVFTLSGTDLERFSEYRFILETAALRLAFRRNSEGLVAELTSIWHQMERAKKADERSQYLELDLKYHRAMFALCDNHYLSESYRLIEAKVSAIRTYLGKERVQTTKSFEEHGEMIDALREGRIDDAIRTLDFHIGRYHRTFSADVADIADFSKVRPNFKEAR